MSTTMILIDHLATSPGLLSAAGDGYLDLFNQKSTEAMATVRTVGVLSILVFIVITIWKTRMAMGALVMSLLVGGFASWGLWNVTDLRDRTNDELNNGAPAIHDLVGQNRSGQ